MRGWPAKRGATRTIVSSDKDLMQLVTDCVTMYDTMKDRRIGIAEVIEKFGVPPEKVIEVQALIGDSTDNVPGVPGIGVKTAAQLIVEYGDLETLLERAGEIKQEKRRETLIDNAEQARISRAAGAARRQGRRSRCRSTTSRCTSPTHEADRVPQGDGVLHADAPGRGDIRGIDAVADRGGCRLRAARARRPAPRQARRPTLAGDRSAGAAAPRQARRRRAASPPSRRRCTPAALAAARAEAARRRQIDRSEYETVRDARPAQGLDRARQDAGIVAFDTETTSLDPMQAELCGFSLALAPNEACYVPLAHKQSGGGDDLFARRPSRRTRSQAARRARGAEAAAGGPGRAQGRPDLKYRLP